MNITGGSTPNKNRKETKTKLGRYGTTGVSFSASARDDYRLFLNASVPLFSCPEPSAGVLSTGYRRPPGSRTQGPVPQGGTNRPERLRPVGRLDHFHDGYQRSAAAVPENQRVAHHREPPCSEGV